MKMTKVFIDGQEGTTGLKIVERLVNRTDIELLRIDEAKRKDTEERRKFINASDFIQKDISVDLSSIFCTVFQKSLYDYSGYYICI